MKKRWEGEGEDGQEVRSEMLPAVPARCPTAGTAGSPGSRCPGSLEAETHSEKKNEGYTQTLVEDWLSASRGFTPTLNAPTREFPLGCPSLPSLLLLLLLSIAPSFLR